MARLLILLVLATGLLSCATRPAVSEDQFVGRWKGPAMLPANLVIEKDHTGKFGLDPVWWSFHDGKYWLRSRQNEPEHMTCTLTNRGELEFQFLAKDNDDKDKPFHRPMVFHRVGLDGKPLTNVSVADVAKLKEQLNGMWCFGYTRQAPFMNAPGFDQIAFEADDYQTTSTYFHQQTHGQFKLNGNRLTLDGAQPMTGCKELVVAFEDDGKRLLLEREGEAMIYSATWVFVRPDQLLPNELDGKWSDRESQPDKSLWREMTLGADGHLLVAGMNQGRIAQVINGNGPDFFRLWRAPWGPSMTTTFMTPGLGLQSMTMRYERRGDTLTVTPLDPAADSAEPKLIEQGREVWQRLP